MSMIVDVYGREVLDSRGNPTVEVEVALGLRTDWRPSFFVSHLSCTCSTESQYQTGVKLHARSSSVNCRLEDGRCLAA